MNDAASVAARPRPRWPLALGITLALLLLVALAGAAIVSWLGDWGLSAPIHVVIDGEDTWTFDPSVVGSQHPIGVVVGLVIAVLAVVVVVPLALSLAFVALAIGLAVGIGMPLLVLTLVAALLLSPLLLLVGLSVWVARRVSGPRTVPAANITP
jgi:hypothetical protein